MKFDLELDAAAVERMTGVLGGYADRAGDLTPLWDTIIDVFETVSDQRFRSRGGTGGWVPLAPAYERQRQRQGKGTGILEYDSESGGRLRASMTSREASYAVRRVRQDSVTIGTSLAIAAPHHRGHTARTRWGSHRIPARPLVDRDDLDEHFFIATANHVHGSDGQTAAGLV